MNKMLRIMELVWLCAAGLSAIAAVYFLVMKDTDNAIFFVFAFLISAVLHLLRKYQRKKQEAFEASQSRPPQKKK